MRLRSIYLDDYRILNEFSLHFVSSPQEDILETSAAHHYSLDLLVGINGTGKSTLLRAIAEIFRRLHTTSGIPFGFEISYELHDRHTDGTTLVTISNLDKEQPPQPLKGGYLRLQHNEIEEPLKEAAQISKDYLPPLIVAFTTGDESDWELPKEKEEETSSTSQTPGRDTPDIKAELVKWFLSEIPGEPVEEQEQGPSTIETDNFLFIKEGYLPLVILCSLLDDMNRSQQSGEATKRRRSHLRKVLEACNIKALRGFSLKFRMNKDALLNADYRFIRELASFAQTIQTGSDYLLTFDLAEVDLWKLVTLRGDSLTLFRDLVRLSERQNSSDPILREVNLFLERTYKKKEDQEEEEDSEQGAVSSPLHLLKWFSDGERSFLGRLCLLSLLGSSQQEALVLLDEPEVHFNDYWKRQLVSMIDSTLGEQYSHVLMTTHSSITLSDVLNRDIWVLRRNANHTKSATPPALRTLGADPSDIMVYVFDAEKATGAHSTALIQRKLAKIADLGQGSEDDEIKAKKREELEALLKLVGPSDLRFLIRRELHAVEGD